MQPVVKVKVEAGDEDSEVVPDESEGEGSAMIFSQDTPVNKTVKLDYSKKVRYEDYYTHDYHVICDGEEIIAYCIEPEKKIDAKKNYKATPYNDALMTKALYYSYGNPGYSEKTRAYLSDISRKNCYKGNEGAYILCHIMLSYIYDGESSDTDAFKGCSKATKKVVKNLLAAVKSWPDPPGKSEIHLSETSVNAKWNEETSKQETPEIKVTGTSGNSIEVPVPEGATLCKDGSKITSGSVKVSVDESFRITAPDSVRGTYESPAMEAAITDFQPYIITPKGMQSQVFNLDTIHSVSYSINWMDFGKVELIKNSAKPEITDGNTDYSLTGACYGLYSKDTENKYADLVTDSQGKACVDNVPYGEYYVKETKASKGYDIDVSSHDINVSAPSQSIEVLEEPIVAETPPAVVEKSEEPDEPETTPDETPGETPEVKTTEKPADTPAAAADTPEVKKDGYTPETGDGMNLLLLAFAMAASCLLGLSTIMKKN